MKIFPLGAHLNHDYVETALINENRLFINMKYRDNLGQISQGKQCRPSSDCSSRSSL